MPESSIDDTDIRARVLSLLEKVAGYRSDPETDSLEDLDSLQVLELMVLLEEEFGIDADEIVEAGPGWWWSSLSRLVASIGRLVSGTDVHEPVEEDR